MRPVFLDAGELLAGAYHAPEGTFNGTGVLLVPPHGWDDQGAFRPRRAWAYHLASAGFAALRIDLPGSGDSAGHPRDADRLGAWTAAVSTGVRWLREPVGARRVAVIAMGMGGLITLAAIDQGAEVDDLVLWGVPVKGRALVRELMAFGRLEASQTGEKLASAPPGELRAGGHVLSAESAAAVSGLDATDLLRRRGPARALVLGRDGMGPEEALCSALSAAGARVDRDPGRGWGLATAPSDRSRPPWAVVARVGDWLASAAPGSEAACTEPVEAEVSAELGVNGARVRETPIRFAGGDGHLFGVLAEPAGDQQALGTALLLNAGTLRHIGPNRMWTETARRWAARGIATLRMDVEGVGEADGDSEPYANSSALHVPVLTQQVRTAMDMLAGRGLPDRFLVGGMCSGAYWAFQAGLADERVCGVVSLNQRMFFYDPDAEPNLELRRFMRIFTPTGFRNMLIGDRRLLRLVRLVRWLALTPVRLLARRRNPAPPGDPLNDALTLMRDRGQRLDLAFSAEEPLHDDLVASDRLIDLETFGVRVHELPFVSHTLKPVAAQRAASVVLDEVVARTFGVPEAGQ